MCRPFEEAEWTGTGRRTAYPGGWETVLPVMCIPAFMRVVQAGDDDHGESRSGTDIERVVSGGRASAESMRSAD